MKRFVFAVPLLFVLAASAFRPPVRKGSAYVIIAYVGGFRGLINADSIAVEKLTHINYAFVDIRDGQRGCTTKTTIPSILAGLMRPGP